MSDRDPYAGRRIYRAERRRRQVRRRRAAAMAAVAVLLVAGVALGRSLGGGDDAEAVGGPSSTPASTPAGSEPQSAPPTTQEPEPEPTGTVTLAAVGDSMLGTVGQAAPNASTYFDGVASALTGDVVFANLEGALTNQTSGKCAVLKTACYEFRLPPSYARDFKKAGFTIVSNANNHAFDFWQAGLDETVAALDRVGLAHTGRTREITYVDVRDLTLAFIGVGTYPNTGPLNDYTAARRMIRTADRRADIVVVAMHAGAEGTSALHLTGADEIYGGENRGNPIAFAHMAIDAGADLILGYSPHVLRAMEIYKKRLIAYSLGNFAGYHNFTLDGLLGVSGVLRVKLAADGRLLRGRFVSTRLVGAGQPAFDPAGTGANLIAQLSREDIGARGVRFGAGGVIKGR